MITFLQANFYETSDVSSVIAAGFGMAFFLLVLLIIFFSLFIFYKIFQKAQHPNSWGAFIPIYNVFVRLDVIKRPWWQLFMYMIPFYGLYLAIVDINRLSKFFGKDEGFTIGLIFLPIIFYPILAFGSAKYNPNALPDERDN